MIVVLCGIDNSPLTVWYKELSAEANEVSGVSKHIPKTIFTQCCEERRQLCN